MKKTNKMKNLLKCFKKIWDEKEGRDELTEILIEKLSDKLLDEGEKIKEEEYTIFLNNATIMGIIPKKKELKSIIENHFYTNNVRTNIFETLNDFVIKEKEEIKSNYFGEYLTIIFNLIKGYDIVTIKMRKNSPIWVETDDFICVLAPRVDEEEKMKGGLK